MTQEEYIARRKELQRKITELNRKKRIDSKKLDDEERRIAIDAANKIKAFTEKVDNEKNEAHYKLLVAFDEIIDTYVEEKSSLETEINILDAKFKRQYYKKGTRL